MKRLGVVLIFNFMMFSSLFASSQDVLKKDISKIFTNGKLDKSFISIIAQDKVGDLKDLHVLIGTIKGSRKPFLLLYNKETMIVGNIKNRKDGKSIFDNFIKKNRTKIEQALSKIGKKEKSKKIKNNKKLISLLSGDYKDLVFTIKGKNPTGKIIYLITDPNCPYCKRYEKKQLPKMIKNSKEVRVVSLFLKIRGHETSAMRSSWLLQRAKNDKNADMLSFMHKASNTRDNTYKEVDKTFAKQKITKMKKLLAKRLIRGTPTIFDENGNPVR